MGTPEGKQGIATLKPATHTSNFKDCNWPRRASRGIAVHAANVLISLSCTTNLRSRAQFSSIKLNILSKLVKHPPVAFPARLDGLRLPG
ncbi:hypothetical protein ABH945_000086 [Paraburkholderia sp. GAS333]